VRDERVRKAVVSRVLAMAGTHDLGVSGLTRSPITGPAGNVEYLAWFRKGVPGVDMERLIATVFDTKVQGS
jgi:23S rRNA (cytidine1920-2'-O)/16S rRNA (cytidine1409-2'-O)-methyltransferase